jgi:hypothetical protein
MTTAPRLLAGALFATLVLAGECKAQSPIDGGRLSGPDLARRIEAAHAFPLGSRENPVRVDRPPGQRAYLSRLRCAGGGTPDFNRVGSFGSGPFGSIIDGYELRCAGEGRGSRIFLDMYHPEHREDAAPPGFTIAPPRLPGTPT